MSSLTLPNMRCTSSSISLCGFASAIAHSPSAGAGEERLAWLESDDLGLLGVGSVVVLFTTYLAAEFGFGGLVELVPVDVSVATTPTRDTVVPATSVT